MRRGGQVREARRFSGMCENLQVLVRQREPEESGHERKRRSVGLTVQPNTDYTIHFISFGSFFGYPVTALNVNVNIMPCTLMM
jgi:hypothetical protein